MYIKSYILFFTFLCTVSIAMTGQLSHAQSAGDKSFVPVVVNDPPHPDTVLARQLLKNMIDDWRKIDDTEVFLSAKKIEFKGQNGKALLFIAVAHPTTCLARDCEITVLVKDDNETNWRWGFQTYASLYLLDTRKQTADFPRILTQQAGKPYEYWRYNEGKYSRAGGR